MRKKVIKLEKTEKKKKRPPCTQVVFQSLRV